MNGNSKVTIKDVARQAGVSTQTVSRVINDRPDVAMETRERVKAIIQKLGYHPSMLARGLIQGRSCTLGVVTAGLKYIGPSRTLNGITSEAEAHGYALLLEELPHYTSTEIKPIMERLLSHRVDGILWAVPEIGDNRAWLEGQLSEVPVPIVFLTMQPRPGIESLAIDNHAGAKMAIQHLLEKGHRSIAHLAGPQEWWEARERLRGWQDALREAGLDPIVCVEGNWSSSSGEQAALKLLENHHVDAVFSANDQMALSLLLVAQRRGMRIPNDLAVAGFDDLAESAYFYPPLTTIHQDQFALGSRSVNRLVDIINIYQEGKVPEPMVEMILPELVVRSTT